MMASYQRFSSVGANTHILWFFWMIRLAPAYFILPLALLLLLKSGILLLIDGILLLTDGISLPNI
jgi:hypothetical protein